MRIVQLFDLLLTYLLCTFDVSAQHYQIIVTLSMRLKSSLSTRKK